MSIQTDIERVQKKNLRRRQKMEWETCLRKNLTDPHDDDLVTMVTANRKRAAYKEKINQLRRHR